MENLTDKDLLDLAAKAAGISAYWTVGESIQQWPVFVVSCGGGMGTMTYEQEWNPLKNDVDAFRLAVYLKISIKYDHLPMVYASRKEHNLWAEIYLSGKDDESRIRRLIVKAAAKIQINKEEQK